jgi:acetyltransferase
MPILNLDKVFHPGRIAVIGASRRSRSVGNTVLRNLIDGGFEGDVYPVNPKDKTICNTPCFANVGELPNPPDLAVICTAAQTVRESSPNVGRPASWGL